MNTHSADLTRSAREPCGLPVSGLVSQSARPSSAAVAAVQRCPLANFASGCSSVRCKCFIHFAKVHVSETSVSAEFGIITNLPRRNRATVDNADLYKDSRG